MEIVITLIFETISFLVSAFGIEVFWNIVVPPLLGADIDITFVQACGLKVLYMFLCLDISVDFKNSSKKE